MSETSLNESIKRNEKDNRVLDDKFYQNYPELKNSDKNLQNIYDAIIENPENIDALSALLELSSNYHFIIPKDIIDIIFMNIENNKMIDISLSFLSNLIHFFPNEVRSIISVDKFMILVNNMLNPIFIRPISSLLDVSAQFRQCLILSESFTEFMKMISIFASLKTEDSSADISNDNFVDAHYFLQCISNMKGIGSIIISILALIYDNLQMMDVDHQTESILTFYTFFYYQREEMERFDISNIFLKIESNYNPGNEKLVSYFLNILRLYQSIDDFDIDQSEYEEGSEESAFEDEDIDEIVSFIHQTPFIDMTLQFFSSFKNDIQSKILSVFSYFIYMDSSLIKTFIESGFFEFLISFSKETNVKLSLMIIRFISCSVIFGNTDVVIYFVEHEILEMLDHFIIYASDHTQEIVSKCLCKVIDCLTSQGNNEIIGHILSLENIIQCKDDSDIFIKLDDRLKHYENDNS